MEEPILSPPIPYVGPICGGRFTPEKIVKIQGITPSTAYRDDVCMQISVRMLDGHISLNSLQNGIWGEEQYCLTLPIKRAEEFEMSVKCDVRQYEIAINGQHFHNFRHRIDYNRITHLAIDGDVSINRISYASVSRGEGGTSGEDEGWVSQATAPLVEISNEIDNSELVNSNTAAPPLPSYDAAIQNSQIGFVFGNTPVAGSPYLTTAPHPTTSSYPPIVAPYPTEPPITVPGVSPYNINGRAQCPYPTGGSYTTAYPPPGGSGLPQGAPIPLNAASSNFQPVHRWYNRKKSCSAVMGVILGIIIAVVVVIIKKNKPRHHHHHHY